MSKSPLLDFLHGTWLGHPLHPILVNLPTALWPAALVFDLLSHVADGAVFVRLSSWSIGLGLLGALAAAPTGLADWSDVGRDKPAWKFGLYHLILNVVAVVLFAANFVLRLRLPADVAAVPALPLVLSAVGAGILAVSGYLGGRMVYDYGTYVGWMSLKKWRRIAEAGGARVPPEG